MNIRRRVAGGIISVLCLAILLGMLIIPAQARVASVQFVKRHHFPSESVPPGIPQSRRPLYSPPVFMDRSAPISERPLAPIGNGGQIPPESVPFVWCHGQWVRANNLRQSCP
jgi:hypothetical protein